jgi:hypothetical protein
MEYVSRINQLETLMDTPIKFEETVKQIKGKIHQGRYNRNELLNVWRTLTQRLKDGIGEAQIRCLLDHKIEFLNYSHDYEPMVQLLTYGSPELVESVVAGFSVKKRIGFQNEHEPKLSLSQDVNMNCPVMNCLELLRHSQGKELIEYKKKMEILLKELPFRFNFTLKYLSNGTLYYTTPLAYSLVNHEPLMADYIKFHGGTLNYTLEESLCDDCAKSYYTFFMVNEVHMPLLTYFEQTNNADYGTLVKKTRTLKNRKGEKRKNETQRIQPSLNLNDPGITMNTLKERIRLNKEKRNLLFEPLTLKQNHVPHVPHDTITTRKTKPSKPNRQKNPFVVVGGVGGSGTRLIASILATLGLQIGTDLNEAYDNLSFTLLYKHLNTLKMDTESFDESYRILTHSILGTRNFLTDQDKKRLEGLSEKGRPGHPRAWLQERVKNLFEINQNGPLENSHLKELANIHPKPLLGKWGWKEPNSHLLMNRLNKQTKFIMVVRNGLDMAFSSNQNQLRLWGPTILPKEMRKFDKHGHLVYSPRIAMKYWTLVHKKVLRDSKVLGDKFLMINFDDMCIHPDKWLRILCHFLNVNTSVIPEIRPLVVYQSEGIGRFKKYSLSQFDPSDIAFAKSIGFDTDPH